MSKSRKFPNSDFYVPVSVAEVGVASGAIDPAVRTTLVTVDGTVAYQLADGAYFGERKSLRCTAAINTPDGVLTPANLVGGTTLTFAVVEDACELEWQTGGWTVVNLNGAVLA